MNTARLNQGTPLLLNAVSKHYAENIVLNQLDLHIPAGQFVAVVGRSGGGKSTLLRLLAGLETPTAGDVLAGTTPLAEIQEDTRMMFQDARLLPWKSVIDNVGLGLKGQWRDAARRALAAVGLENRAGEWPAALSGGQKQRVALARALIHRPGLLLLDEPLGALDALTRLEMQDLIVSLWQQHGFTVLLVTHDVSEAVAMADRVLLIEEGKIGLDLTVDIPRPRRLGSVRLAELEAEVLQRVMRRGHSEQLFFVLVIMPDVAPKTTIFYGLVGLIRHVKHRIRQLGTAAGCGVNALSKPDSKTRVNIHRSCFLNKKI